MRKTAKQANTGLRPPGPPRRWLAWALTLLLPLAGAACSGSGGSAGSGADQAGAAEDEDYPNLSSVPGEQPRPTPESLRKELVEGLTADRAHARYTGELLTASSAAVPAAAPPPAAKPQVEIIWETLRVLPEGQSETVDEVTVDEVTVDEVTVDEVTGSGAGTAVSGAAAGEPEATADGAAEEVQINWETERVEPSGKVAVAGTAASDEELMLTPQPELVAVVYFADNSAQVGTSDRELLEEVVALYKERGGHLRLVGHSSSQASTEDEVAQRMVNLDLSLQQANAVATTLLDLGAEKEKLMIEAKADSEPASGEAVVGGEDSDRRVEIFFEH